MGHLASKDIYQALGRKVDSLSVRTPVTKTFYAFLKEIYTEQEADVLVRMPWGLSDFDRLLKVTGYSDARLRSVLESMCSKGLVVDLWIEDRYLYMPAPIVVGLFEFTMMRMANPESKKKWSELMHGYIQEDEEFYAANFGSGERVFIGRTLPHEGTIGDAAYVEVLDYEKAASIIEQADRFAIGDCSCRHAMLHSGHKTCDTPLNTCSQFGTAADYMIRHQFAREVSKTEMIENLARSREMGLVLNADNVQRNVTYICQCCSCCCHLLLGVSKFGYPNTLVTSNYIAATDEALCNGCGQCARACPVNVTEMVAVDEPGSKRKKRPVRDLDLCLGCGVCVLKCKTGALTLKKRDQRVLHPETTFERVILQCLERGTLQNQIFDDPGKITHQFMRGFVGGFLRLSPVKRALMSDTLRSRFLDAMKKGIAMQGKGWTADL